MAWTRYSHASVSAANPRALGTCDRCGMVYQRDQLAFQHDWRGPKIQNLRLLVCPTCTDIPQQNGQRAIIIPADPVPILNPRQDPNMFMGQSSDPNNTQFIAVGVDSDGNPSIMVSPNGTDWTESSLSSSLSGTELFSVAYGDGIWVAVGVLGSGLTGSAVIITSTTGSSWTRRSAPVTDANTIYAVTYGGGRFIALSYDANEEATLVFTSTDGISWVSSSTLFGRLWGITYGSSLYVACGSQTLIGGAPLIYTSPDGVTWTSRSLPSIGAAQLMAISHNGSMFVSVGYNQTSNAPLILKSADGITWVQPSYSLTGDITLTAVTYTYGTWVTLGGNEATEGGNVAIYISSDEGVSWEDGVGQVNVVGYPRGIAHADVAGSVLSPVVSVGGISGTFVYLSNDGMAWNVVPAEVSSNAVYNAVAFGSTG